MSVHLAVFSIIFASVISGQGTSVTVVLHAQPSSPCSDGSAVVSPHPLCPNPNVFFPAEVKSFDTKTGNFTLVYGRSPALSENPNEIWSNATQPASKVVFYQCRDSADGWPDGDVGRGFAYVPECNHTNCFAGCRVVPASACEEGEQIEIDGTCTAKCDDATHVPSKVNINCSLEAPLEERTFTCQKPTVYCDEVDEGDVKLKEHKPAPTPDEDAEQPNNSVNTTEQPNSTRKNSDIKPAPPANCTPRVQTTSTTTTTVALLDRVLRGCIELENMSAGKLEKDPNKQPIPLAVGMPHASVGAGRVYFEIRFEGPFEQVGWVDSKWITADEEDKRNHQWLSPHARGCSSVAPCVVAVALSIFSLRTGEVRFSREGEWELKPNGEPQSHLMSFQPPLIPMARLRGRATWHVPSSSWTYNPPAGRFLPLTSRPYPEACRWPLDYKLFSSPPRCGSGFELMNTSDDCAVAAFQLGIEDRSPSVAKYVGWPPGCFRCRECDFSGDLYLNLVSERMDKDGDGKLTLDEILSNPENDESMLDQQEICKPDDASRRRFSSTADPCAALSCGDSEIRETCETTCHMEVGCQVKAILEKHFERADVDEDQKIDINTEVGLKERADANEDEQISAICRRVDGARTSTTTTTPPLRIITTTIVAPLYRVFVGRCSASYLPIYDKLDCEQAAADLLLDDHTALEVTLHNNNSGSSTQWPPGCFRCALCDAGKLYLNAVNVPSDLPEQGDRRSDAEAICRAPPQLLTTAFPGDAVKNEEDEIEWVDEEPEVSSDKESITTSTFLEYTTSSLYEPTRQDLLAKISCDNPYEPPEYEEELPAWIRLLILAGGATVGACCLCIGCCCCWIFGIFDRISNCVSNWLDRHPCINNSPPLRALRCLLRCLGRLCWCCKCVADKLSPRLQKLSPRGLSLSPRGRRSQREDEPQFERQASPDRRLSHQSTFDEKPRLSKSRSSSKEPRFSSKDGTPLRISSKDRALRSSTSSLGDVLGGRSSSKTSLRRSSDVVELGLGGLDEGRKSSKDARAPSKDSKPSLATSSSMRSSRHSLSG